MLTLVGNNFTFTTTPWNFKALVIFVGGVCYEDSDEIEIRPLYKINDLGEVRFGQPGFDVQAVHFCSQILGELGEVSLSTPYPPSLVPHSEMKDNTSSQGDYTKYCYRE